MRPPMPLLSLARALLVCLVVVWGLGGRGGAGWEGAVARRLSSRSVGP